MKVSLVVPCYNEEVNIRKFYSVSKSAFENSGYDLEFVFVDDGSRDDTLKILKEMNAENKEEVRVVSFSRNFGKESAIFAGLNEASGDFISLIDADLQQDPKIAKEMADTLAKESEYDIVAARQADRKDSKFISFCKKRFYSLINKMSHVYFEPNVSDFRTMRKEVRDKIIELTEYHRFSKGIFAWIGFNTKFIDYSAEERNGGVSKWGFRKLLKYAIGGLISYSTIPLKISSFIGILTSLGALIYMIVVVIQKIFFSVSIHLSGYATIVVLILFLGGVQLISVGVLGEYIGKIYEQVKNRPVYIIKEKL